MVMRDTIKKILKEETSKQQIKFYHFVIGDMKSNTEFNSNNNGDVYNVDIGDINIPRYLIDNPRGFIGELKEFIVKVGSRYALQPALGNVVATDYIFWLREELNVAKDG